MKLSGLLFIAITSIAFTSATAAPGTNSVAFERTKYPNIKVRHLPLAPGQKAMEMPKPGTPKTNLPVKKGKRPEDGVYIEVDNTYLIPENAPAKSAAKNPAVQTESRTSTK